MFLYSMQLLITVLKTSTSLKAANAWQALGVETGNGVRAMRGCVRRIFKSSDARPWRFTTLEQVEAHFGRDPLKSKIT